MCLHSQASQSPKIPLSSCSLRINLGAGTLTAAFCGSRHSRVATVERGQPTTWPKWSLVPRLPTFNRQKMTKAHMNHMSKYQVWVGMRDIAHHRAALCSAELFTFHMFSEPALKANLPEHDICSPCHHLERQPCGIDHNKSTTEWNKRCETLQLMAAQQSFQPFATLNPGPKLI